MVKRYAVTLSVLADIPGLTGDVIVAAITMDLNARGIVLESISIKEVTDGRQQPVQN